MPTKLHTGIMRSERRDIKPAAPDSVIRGLLAVPYAQLLPLEAGDQREGYGKTGDYILAAAVRGNWTVSAYDQYALLDPGQVFLLREPGSYRIQAVSGGLGLLLCLRGELPERLLAGRVMFAGGAAAVREAVLSLAVLEDEQGLISGGTASALAYTMLLKLRALPQSPAREVGSPLVEAAVGMIQDEFPFLEGVDELAERLEVSAAHLTRVFSKKVGISPGKYITRVRIEYAKLLLQDPDATIAYVAEASGFANANYFAKVFRKETGMSPSEYLESGRFDIVHKKSRVVL